MKKKYSVKKTGIRNDSIKGLKKDHPYKIEKLEEALFNFIGGNNHKGSKTEFLDDKSKHLTEKLANPYEDFNSFDDYDKPVDNLKKEDFFSKKMVILVMKKEK